MLLGFLPFSNLASFSSGLLVTDLVSASLSLFQQSLLSLLLTLGLVDVLHQNTLVLELITLDLEIQLVIPTQSDLILPDVLTGSCQSFVALCTSSRTS